MKRLVVEIDDEMHQKIRQLAVDRMTTIRDVVLDIITRTLNRKGNKNEKITH